MSVDPTSEDWMDGYKTAEAELQAELEQARKERDAAVMAGAMAHEYVKRERDRYRDALERIADIAYGKSVYAQIARDALAGKGQT